MMKRKHITAAVLSALLMASSAVTAFADPYDFFQISLNKKHSILDVATKTQVLLDVATKESDFTIELKDGKKYPLADYIKVMKDNPTFTEDQVIEELNKMGLKVVSVSAITKTEVEVEFAEALAEDVKEATVKVTDNKGMDVAVVAKDLAKGTKVASFKFVKALDKNPEGKWIVNGVEKDLDLEAKLLAVKKAGDDQLKLKAALEALGIKNIDPAKYPSYAKANKANTEGYKTVEEVQKMVDDVNALNEDAVVKAVLDAKQAGNAVALATALQNEAFKRVNPEWTNIPTNGYMNTIAATDKTIEAIQTKIDNSNVAIMTTELVDTGIDKAKLEKSHKLVVDYAKMKEDGKTPIDGTIKGKFDNIMKQLALVEVLEASTPSSLKAKLTALAELDSALDMKNYKDLFAEAYLSDIEKAAVTAKDEVSEINGLLMTANTREENALIVKIKAATEADALLKLLKKAQLENIVDENKDAYLASVQDTGSAGSMGHASTNTLALMQTALNKVNKAALVPDATESGKDLKSDKDVYTVGEDIIVTFTLKDSTGKVLTSINGTTDATVKVNTDPVSLAKATIENGKVKVTGKLGKAAAKHDLKVSLVDPKVDDVTKTGVKIEVKAAEEPVHFKVEQGATKGVKFTALDVNYQTMGSYDGTVRMENVVLKAKDGAGQYTQVVALDGLTLGNADIEFDGSGVADDQLNSAALANGDYQLTFTVDGVAHTLTFKKS